MGFAAQLDVDRELAHAERQAGAAFSASMAKAKLFGLDVNVSNQDELKFEWAAMIVDLGAAAGKGVGCNYEIPKPH